MVTLTVGLWMLWFSREDGKFVLATRNYPTPVACEAARRHVMGNGAREQMAMRPWRRDTHFFAYCKRRVK